MQVVALHQAVQVFGGFREDKQFALPESDSTTQPLPSCPASSRLKRGNPFELTCEPMLCNGLSSEAPVVSVAQRQQHGRVWFSELLGRAVIGRTTFDGLITLLGFGNS